MNTRIFTLTPGHLMESSSECQPQGNGTSPSMSLPRSCLAGDRESNSSPSISTAVDPRYRAVLPWTYSRPSAASLLVHLPPRPVTDYFVAVYFSTVHWFMVVMHEGHFLHHYRSMMDLYAKDSRLLSNTDEDFTFALLILTVAVLGGRYTSVHLARAKQCRQIHADSCRMSSLCEISFNDTCEFDIVKMTSQIFSVVRSSHTDTLACGTISAVQLLLLLGSLYLYHGESNLAWANSGCTIRAAQALGLHKDKSELRWNSPYCQLMELAEKEQLRRRLFWAVHTSDRFLAMCYGLPLLISDDDCSADAPCEDNIYPPRGCSSFLMLEDDLDEHSLTSLFSGTRAPVTLLTYQTYKMHIYIILGDIISSLYRPSSSARVSLLSKYDSQESASTPSKLQLTPEELLKTVQRLERKLQNWYTDIPVTLRLSKDMTYPGYNELISSTDGDDDDVILPTNDDLLQNSPETRKRRVRIRKGIYGIQGLLLQLAYDNALILIHRPILALKNGAHAAWPRKAFAQSVDACWNAALRISKIDNHHIFRQNQQVHPVSYVGVHLFTAGVVLSVFGSSAPLSRRALEAKQGLRRIIRMQKVLRKKVIVSSQSLSILENLAREVVKKEMAAILAQDMDDDEDQAPDPERVALREPWINGNGTVDAPTIVETMGLERQNISSRLDAAAGQGGVLSGEMTDFSNDLMFQNDFFNESVLDIEKFLLDPQFPSIPKPGMANRRSTGNNQQPAGLWCFSYDQVDRNARY
ncbi:fungal-specific transcription factor domain-containing protein [Dactylonectria estremocensis]|uniref:Fungal-specific transcription factor domain-containing protein n=1 Tax=Dactylonectria estremocensis TaxID=1079267 RepID=A0A9P9FEP6_9HYPO|nr:fungal-specific transcription factor domain-containing protein [Dactylonectria estremocensis]